MLSINRVIRLFVRQQNHFDCGISCLGMILNYSGKSSSVPELLKLYTHRKTDMSLLELRQIARSYNLPARCVEMEVDFLKYAKLPAILLMKNESDANHYQVFFGTKSTLLGARKYLIADPSGKVHLINQTELQENWPERSALYFEKLTYSPLKKRPLFFSIVFSVIPKGLYFTMPLLSVMVTTLGIVISWMLQRGYKCSLDGKSINFLMPLFLLLLIINLSKNLFNHVKQRILIIINRKVSRQLTGKFLQSLFTVGEHREKECENPIKKNLAAIQKIQNSISVFMSTIISDGALILLIVGTIVYILPIAGLIDVAYFLALFAITLINIPRIHFEKSNFSDHAAMVEILAEQSLLIGPSTVPVPMTADEHAENYEAVRNSAHNLSLYIGRKTFISEVIGTFVIVSVYGYAELCLQLNQLGYDSLIIVVLLSYYLIMQVPRFYDAFYMIHEGIEAFYSSNFYSDNIL